MAIMQHISWHDNANKPLLEQHQHSSGWQICTLLEMLVQFVYLELTQFVFMKIEEYYRK